MDAGSAVDLLREGLNHCVLVIDRERGPLLALATAGLVGGFSHCAGMCGPFVLTQVGARLERLPLDRMTEWRRLAGAAVIPYHLGRTVTYALVGAAAAGVAGHVGALGGLRWLSTALLGFAALFFLAYALRGFSAWTGAGARLAARLGEKLGAPLGPAEGAGAWGRRVSRLARPLFDAPVGGRGFLLGMALGLIPCGLVYGAVAVAAAGGDPLAGAFGMLAFAFGTVPALVTVGIAGHLAGRRWRPIVARVAPLIMVVNAGVLGWMAVRMAGV